MRGDRPLSKIGSTVRTLAGSPARRSASAESKPLSRIGSALRITSASSALRARQPPEPDHHPGGRDAVGDRLRRRRPDSSDLRPPAAPSHTLMIQGERYRLRPTRARAGRWQPPRRRADRGPPGGWRPSTRAALTAARKRTRPARERRHGSRDERASVLPSPALALAAVGALRRGRARERAPSPPDELSPIE